MVDSTCGIETPFDLDEALVWIDDGYERMRVGLDAGSIQIIDVPGEVHDVAVVGTQLFASIDVPGPAALPSTLRLMHWDGAWASWPNQPPPQWTGELDGRHAAMLAGDSVTIYDFRNGRVVANKQAPEADVMGFVDGRYWFRGTDAIVAIGVGTDLLYETGPERGQDWAVDGDLLLWHAYVEASRQTILHEASPSGVSERARWPHGSHPGELVVAKGDELVVGSLAIDGWLEMWQPTPTSSTTEATLAEDVPMPLGYLLLALAASKTVSRRRD